MKLIEDTSEIIKPEYHFIRFEGLLGKFSNDLRDIVRAKQAIVSSMKRDE